jgi:hypothetical protein
MFHEFIQTEWNAVRQLEGEALNNQGMCYIRMGDYEMSERRARKCLEILQENVKVGCRRVCAVVSDTFSSRVGFVPPFSFACSYLP